MKRSLKIFIPLCFVIFLTSTSCAVIENSVGSNGNRSAYYTPKNWYIPIQKGGASSNVSAEKKPAIVAAPARPSGPVSYVNEGVASWYGPNFHGKQTANGEIYDQHGLTAAHKYLPLNSLVKVTNLENNKQVIVRINDRGPYAKDRILDGSYMVAQKLGYDIAGTTRVKLEVIQFPNDFDSRYGLDAYKQSVVQLGAFKDADSADQFKNVMANRYSTLPLMVDQQLNNTFYVVVGPYDEKDAASRVGDSLRRDGVSNIVRSFRK